LSHEAPLSLYHIVTKYKILSFLLTPMNFQVISGTKQSQNEKSFNNEVLDLAELLKGSIEGG